MREPLKGFFTAICVVGLTLFCMSMGRAGSLISFYALPLVSLALPLLTPNLKFLVGVIVFYALALAALIGIVAIEEDMDAGGAIAMTIFAWVFITFAAGAFSRFFIPVLYGYFSRYRMKIKHE